MIGHTLLPPFFMNTQLKITHQDLIVCLFSLYIYLYQLTYRNALPLIFLLFRFQCQFNEQLLQFLITVVDAELFEAIDTKYFKAIDIQETHKAAFQSLLKTKQKINKK